MSINFPDTPSLNQVFIVGDKRWIWDGTSWNSVAAGYTGSKGDLGFTGSIGFTGSQGIGFTGSRGDTGFVGSQGVIGFTGSQGPTVYPSSGIAVSTGTAWSTSLTAPTGALVGTTDTQTLTNKTLNGANLSGTIVGSPTFTGTPTFSGTSSALGMILNDAAEVITVSATAATGTINYDVTTQTVLYYTTNASSNWTVNFRGSSGTSLNSLLSVGQSITAAFLVTQGSSAYFNNAVQVDGSSVTPRYQGGTAWTAGNASGIDVYVYTIIKTANATFTVLASQTQFK